MLRAPLNHLLVDTGRRSLQAAWAVASLAQDLGIPRVGALANRLCDDADLHRVTAGVGTIPRFGLVGWLAEAPGARCVDGTDDDMTAGGGAAGDGAAGERRR